MGKRGLHLNQEANTVFTINSLHAIRNFENNINNDFFCNNNLLNVNSNEKIFKNKQSVIKDDICKNIKSGVTERSRLGNIYLKKPMIGYINNKYF